MKTVAALLVMIITCLPLFAQNSSIDKAIEVVHSKHKNLLVLRTEKHYRGSILQIYHSSGDLVSSQFLKKRRVVIDFCDVKEGTYTVKIVKGKEQKEFLYAKKI